MKTLKTIPLALAALALSSAALAHGWDRGYRGHARWHEERREARVEARYEQRNEARCESAAPMVYAPARVVVEAPRVVIRPGIRVQLSLGL